MENQGYRLEILMKKLGIKNQTELAEELDLGQTAISAIKTGKNGLSSKNLIKLSDLCNARLGKQLNLNWLVLNIGDMFLSSTNQITKYSDLITPELKKAVKQEVSEELARLGYREIQ